MKKFQKKSEKETLNFRTPDWFKGKKSIGNKPKSFKSISFRGTQHRG